MAERSNSTFLETAYGITPIFLVLAWCIMPVALVAKARIRTTKSKESYAVTRESPTRFSSRQVCVGCLSDLLVFCDGLGGPLDKRTGISGCIQELAQKRFGCDQLAGVYHGME